MYSRKWRSQNPASRASSPREELWKLIFICFLFLDQRWKSCLYISTRIYTTKDQKEWLDSKSLQEWLDSNLKLRTQKTEKYLKRLNFNLGLCFIPSFNFLAAASAHVASLGPPRGLLYDYQKVDKGWNFRSTKRPSKCNFIIFNHPTSWLLITKHCNFFILKCYNIFQTKCSTNIGHVWMEVLVLVCSKLTPKLTLWSQIYVLVWC
jgi:hypothetical protein